MEAYHVHMLKMMLPATQTSCLKDSHTNFQINVGIGILVLYTFVGDCNLYAKTSAGNIKSISLKYHLVWAEPKTITTSNILYL